jgi:hypothetical protein
MSTDILNPGGLDYGTIRSLQRTALYGMAQKLTRKLCGNDAFVSVQEHDTYAGGLYIQVKIERETPLDPSEEEPGTDLLHDTPVSLRIWATDSPYEVHNLLMAAILVAKQNGDLW